MSSSLVPLPCPEWFAGMQCGLDRHHDGPHTDRTGQMWTTGPCVVDAGAHLPKCEHSARVDLCRFCGTSSLIIDQVKSEAVTRVNREDSERLASDLAKTGKLPGWTYLDILSELVPAIRESGWDRARTVRLSERVTQGGRGQ